MPQPSALASHLGYWLRFVSNHVSHAFRRAVEAAGVSVSEWVLLRELHGAPHTSPSALAVAIGMTRGAVSKQVDRLVARGLVTRTVVAADRRNHTLALTPAGRALVPRLARLADRNDEHFFGHMTPEARGELLRALQDLVRTHGMKAVPVE